jgi:hypothetical protein
VQLAIPQLQGIAYHKNFSLLHSKDPSALPENGRLDLFSEYSAQSKTGTGLADESL